MLQSRVDIVQANLARVIESHPPALRRLDRDESLRNGSSLTAARALELFQDQVRSRLLDAHSRTLKKQNQSFYTIASAGHEQNAVLGAQLRPTDPCFLHYRSGALMMARARKDPTVDPILDTLLSFVASRDDPISGGRHKVWGSRALWVPPQTSTIASHLPKAMGTAFAVGRRKELGLDPALPSDAIVMCSFGDASANHATALSGINAARYAFRRGNPCPILFVCEDNRVGISVEKPRRWIADSFAGLSQLEYFAVTTGDLVEVWDTVEKAVAICRDRRKPVFLRIPTVRLWGHAGSDVETTYRSLEEIERVETQDPLLANARLLIETGASSSDELLAVLDGTQRQIEQASAYVVKRPKLETVDDVVAPLAPFDAAAIRASRRHDGERSAPARRLRRAASRGRERADEAIDGRAHQLRADRRNAPPSRSSRLRGRRRAQGRRVLRDDRIAEPFRPRPRLRHAPRRNHDSGTGAGLAHLDLLPIPEIQYLAYLHNAIDQLRGEACSLQFFSNGQFRNRWSCASPDSRTSAASGGTSTTTTRSARSARSRACCSRSPAAATTRPACCAA